MDAVEEVVTAAADEVVSAEVVSPPISRSLQDAGPVSHPSNTTHIDARARQDCEGRRDEGDWITFLQPMSSRTRNSRQQLSRLYLSICLMLQPSSRMFKVWLTHLDTAGRFAWRPRRVRRPRRIWRTAR